MSLGEEAQAFVERQRAYELSARQLAAVQLLCGKELSATLQENGAQRLATLRRLRRIMERERLKGVIGNPDYSLDRHIALRDSLVSIEDEGPSDRRPMRQQTRPGARHRHILQLKSQATARFKRGLDLLLPEDAVQRTSGRNVCDG